MGFATAPTGDTSRGMIAADMATLLPDDYLVKVDRASMAMAWKSDLPCSTTN